MVGAQIGTMISGKYVFVGGARCLVMCENREGSSRERHLNNPFQEEGT